MKPKDPGPRELKETCEVCDRVAWGNFQPLGLGRWRHAECYPGGRNWLEAYGRNVKQSEAGDFLVIQPRKEQSHA